MIDADELQFIPHASITGERTVMLIKDCPQDNELKKGRGYSSQSSRMDFQVLEAAGISSKDIFPTYLMNFRPPGGELSTLFWKKGVPVEGFIGWGEEKNCFILDYVLLELKRLREEIQRVKPAVIILAGKWSLFFLTGETKQLETTKSSYGTLLKWRASSLVPSAWWEITAPTLCFPSLPFNPTWELPDKVYLVKKDVKRLALIVNAAKHGGVQEYLARREDFIILSDEGSNTDFSTVYGVLVMLLQRAESGALPLAMDIETIAYTYIDCLSIAWSESEAICIPFECKERAHYWAEHHELVIYKMLKELFLHPNVQHWGQNYHYDAQFFLRNMCIRVDAEADSQTMNHTLYSVMEKRLDFLSSLYCKVHRYWKGNGKIDAKTKKRPDNVDRWEYNCRDTTITFEVVTTLKRKYLSAGTKLNAALHFQQQEVAPALFEIMHRGMHIDTIERDRQISQLQIKAEALQKRFTYAMMQPVNLNSSQQLMGIFYDLFKCPKVFKKTTDEQGNVKNSLTLDEAVLVDLWDTQPLLRNIIDILLDYKKLTKTASGLASLSTDIDGRLRTMYGLTGTDTYRFNSKANAFGTGSNLQVLSKGGYLRNGDKLTNSKKLIKPPAGYTMFDIDLDSADLRIVVAESGATGLQQMLDAGLKPYVEMMKEFYHDPTKSKHSAEYRIFKGFAHGCLTGDHEILTPGGWVRLDQYNEVDEIAVWNKSNWEISFEVPKGFNKDFVAEGEPLVHIKGTSFEQLTTYDHKFPYTTDKRSALNVGIAGKLPNSARLPYVGNYVGGKVNESNNIIRLIAALQADGNIDYTDSNGVTTFRWHFRKRRKIDRLIGILEAAYIEYTNRVSADGSTTIRVKGVLQPYMKVAGSYLLQYSKENLEVWVQESLYWDGHERTSNGVRSSVSTTCEQMRDWLQTITHLVGKGCKVITKERDATRKTIYEISQNNREFFNLSCGSRKLVDHKGTNVYCPQTSTGFFMVRYKGNIMVTGNTNYLGSAKGIAANLGLLVHEVDRLQKWYLGRNPEISQWHKEVERQVFKRGWIENVWGYRRYFLDLKEHNLMQGAVAWVPQSTVALLINHGMCNIRHNLTEVQAQAQTHDSLMGIFPTELAYCKQRIIEECSVVLPYAGRSIIVPVDIGTSEISWGDIG